MKIEYEKRPLSVIILPKGDPIFSKRATTIAIDDCGAGEFVTVKQDDDEICIEKEEWQKMREQIDYLIELCRENND